MLLAASEWPSTAARNGRLGFADARARRERPSTVVTGVADLLLRHARRRGAVLLVKGPHARECSVALAQFHEQTAFESQARGERRLGRAANQTLDVGERLRSE